MIDLHLHFDGSLPIDSVWEQLQKQGIETDITDKEMLRDEMVCPIDCQSLNEYLAKFTLPLSVLQTEDGIRECMRDLVKELASEQMLYAEIRFAPQLHLQKGLSQREVIAAAISGAEEGMQDTNIKVQLILCCMRGTDNHAENVETVQLTKEFLHKGVCACDLAGAEALFATENFEDLFVLAKELNVPYTIHAGEADGSSSMRAALRFGAKRLGHGVRAASDAALVNELVEEKICLECCPISNVQTKAVVNIAEHPIKEFLYRGVLVTVNTDNRTISQTTIAKEIAFLREHLGLTVEEERQLYLNAADNAFLSLEERKGLKDAIKQII